MLRPILDETDDEIIFDRTIQIIIFFYLFQNMCVQQQRDADKREKNIELLVWHCIGIRMVCLMNDAIN